MIITEKRNIHYFFSAYMTLFMIISACNSNEPGTYNDRNKERETRIQEVEKKIDSLQKIVNAYSIILGDSTEKHFEKELKILAPSKEKNPAPAEISKVNKTEKENSEEGEIFYYSNKKVSVKISPWLNGERKVTLFDEDGSQTYEMTEIHKSYSQSVRLKFRENGSVSVANIHNNPGASMYWYETSITFNEHNVPQKKGETRMPVESVNDTKGGSWNWNPANKSWETQVIQKPQ